QSGIGNNLKDDEIVQGSPAFSIGDYKRSYVVFRNLPDLHDRLKTLEKTTNRSDKPSPHE
ncbi:MAG TPA: hypothetical protein VI731_00815, partial [Bacteroidia bacterium]|nr:hypothetical protein [Bacteroidia bacterium]